MLAHPARPTVNTTHASRESLVGKFTGKSPLLVPRARILIGLSPPTAVLGHTIGAIAPSLEKSREDELLISYKTRLSNWTLPPHAQLRPDRRNHVPYGLVGGRPGTPSRNVLNPGTAERELPAKCTLTVRHGDVDRHELAGAGGWGRPVRARPGARAARRDEGEDQPRVRAAGDGVVIDERRFVLA